MIEEQEIIPIEVSQLLGRVKQLYDEKYRIVQIGCTKCQDNLEINYAFDLQYRFVNLRITVPRSGVAIPSVSGIYWSAFLYENEIQDLFGVRFKDMVLDFKGTFYRTAIKHPFNQAEPKKEEA